MNMDRALKVAKQKLDKTHQANIRWPSDPRLIMIKANNGQYMTAMPEQQGKLKGWTFEAFVQEFDKSD